MNTQNSRVKFLNKTGAWDSLPMDNFCQDKYDDSPEYRQKGPLARNATKHVELKINNNTYYTYPMDGRTQDSRGMKMIFDKPSQSTWVPMDEVDRIDNRDYKAFYNNYSQMNNGSMGYYFDTSISQPFYGPIYTLSSTVDKTVLVDPMESHKPQYFKKPLGSTQNNISRDQATKDNLTWREDLISRQQAKYNKTSWTNFNIKPQGDEC